jgi:predicted metal-dependent enzyme (double-stranded beta helix superfamily)
MTTRGADAEWRILARALSEAFHTTDEVCAEHPAAECVRTANVSRLLAEVRGKGQWIDGHYTRTVLLEGEGFIAMLLCWSPGVSSPVHAHSDAETGVRSNCFMRVLEGTLVETLYEPSAIHADCGSVATILGQPRMMAEGSYTYINDAMGVHKVGNASSTEGAISLHVYAPGWSTVQIYDEPAPPVDASGAPLEMDGWGDF